jgi:hypothetical protein
MLGGGFPAEPVLAEMRAMGLSPPRPPNLNASRVEALRELWTGAGLQSVETREIAVDRAFADFDEFWSTNLKGSSVGPTVAGMAPRDVESLKARVRARLPAGSGGRIVYGARANAIKGRLPD